MARTRAGLWVAHLLQLPAPRVYAIPMEIINAIEAIVASEYENLSIVDDSCVSVARRRRRIIKRQYFRPLIILKVKFEEIIAPVRPIIPSKYVEVVIQRHARMQRARARRVILIILLVLDFMPGPWLL